MSEVKVTGHINPDTDSTCSPIVYAWYLSNHKNTPAKAVISGELNKETKYVLGKFGFETPELVSSFGSEDTLVIVDTNNPEELLTGHNEANVIEIIDHHKLVGGLKTDSPIKVTMRPIACTATIIWQMIKEDLNSNISAELAGLLLSAIVSDTLKFTSPTTTDEDKQAANELAEIAKVNIDELANAMFDAKSDLGGMSAQDILKVDSKVFEFGSKKLRISVLETVKPENSLSMIEYIKSGMIEMRENEGLDGVLFFVVDIVNNSSQVFALNELEKEAIQKGFNVELVGDSATLPGVVSRKKQMVPAIEKALS